MMNSIEVKSAEKFYGKGENRKKILNGLNMNVKPGSIYSLIGASGCGKTTLLSCILGMKGLDSGTITVLGHQIKPEKPPKVGHKIGYMPQNTALVPELTIREILYYFGNIFQMKENLLAERYKMLKDLLELPSENSKIQDISGGQQRRVSIAASIIHNPLILILDEPTVGLDSLLRDKIWHFLLDVTRTSNLCVIITTHYISEAERSDRCGLMRDGVLLAEESPKTIMARSGASSLDEAFLNLCLPNANPRLKFDNNELECLSANEPEQNTFVDSSEATVEPFETRKKFRLQTISALLMKEFIRIKRQPGEVFFILIIPIVQMLSFAYSIGDNPRGLKFGIINHEQPDYSGCLTLLTQNASFLDADGFCVYNQNSSCHFLNEITDFEKIFYDSEEEAFKDAKKGKLVGVLSIPQNFTDFIKDFFDQDDLERERKGIEIQADESDFYTSLFVRHRLYLAYQNFNKKLSIGCEQNEKANDYPMNFEETIYGNLKADYKNTMFGPFILQSLIFPAVGFASFSISQNRIDGVWNRTLLAGVKSLELLLTQVILSVIVVFISFIETVVGALLTLNVAMVGDPYILVIFAIALSVTGSTIGIAISSTNDNLKLSSILVFAIIQFLSIISGSFWPLEGQPVLLRYISYCMPITLPAIGVRDVMIKGYTITAPSVYLGLLVLVAWFVASVLVAYFAMKKRKFAET